MKKYVLAAAIAAGALAGLSAQAAPLSSPSSAVEAQVTGTAIQVYHCRWRSGWGCGWGHHRWRSHHRNLGDCGHNLRADSAGHSAWAASDLRSAATYHHAW